MTTTKDNEVSSMKGQVSAICDDLARHSATIDMLLSEKGPVNNLVIQGHMEAHQEKIEESLIEIYMKYDLPENKLSGIDQALKMKADDQLQTQRQGMKLLLGNIKKLEIKVREVLPASRKIAGKSRVFPLSELSRKLNNDFCRTSYLLQ